MAPKAVGEYISQALEYSRDGEHALLPGIPETRARNGLNPGHETEFALSPMNVQLVKDFL